MAAEPQLALARERHNAHKRRRLAHQGARQRHPHVAGTGDGLVERHEGMGVAAPSRLRQDPNGRAGDPVDVDVLDPADARSVDVVDPQTDPCECFAELGYGLFLDPSRTSGHPWHQPNSAGRQYEPNRLGRRVMPVAQASTWRLSPRDAAASSTGAACSARRRRSRHDMPSRTSAGIPSAAAVAISTAWRMIP
jgi:hypothetical protein